MMQKNIEDDELIEIMAHAAIFNKMFSRRSRITFTATRRFDSDTIMGIATNPITVGDMVTLG